MRRLVVLLAAVAFVAVGCADDDSDSTSEQPPATTQTGATPVDPPPPAATPTAPLNPHLFTRADLPRLALRPADAPQGMRYTRRESGHKELFDVGIALDTQIKELRDLDFRAVYDAVFDTPRDDVRLATRLWLFKQESGANQWLERTRANSFAVQLQPIQSPPLADGSWAARGNVGGNDVITHAFRSGNVVVLVTYSTQTKPLSEVDALATTRLAVRRADR